jgi:hypothetical protein
MGALTGLAQSGVAVARTLTSTLQAQEAARQAAQATAIRDEDFDFSDAGDLQSIAGASDSMAIEDAQQFHEMRMQNHDQDMAEARAKNQRDAIAMIENTHQRNPFDDGEARLRLMSRDTTASAAQIMQFAIEDQRPTYPHDGMDIASAAAVGPPSWMELPYPMVLPPSSMESPPPLPM